MTSNFIPVLLVMAVGLGAILIVISIGINLYLQIKNKNYGELFFSQNGVAGLVFYISLIGGGAYQLMKRNKRYHQSNLCRYLSACTAGTDFS